jgi:hypothetical protein
VDCVLRLRRVEPSDTSKTAESRRLRKEQAIRTVEEDLGVNAKSLQMEQIRSFSLMSECNTPESDNFVLPSVSISRIEPVRSVSYEADNFFRGNSSRADVESVPSLQCGLGICINECTINQDEAASLLLFLAKSGR